jgi:DNA invertase Pin-like site-specific DNA recombinase
MLLDELNIEIHLVKEGVVLSQDSKSSEKFFHGIKVLMAKNYIDNLSEEARKGQQEKAEQGIWPTKAPLGYLNVLGAGRVRAALVGPPRHANRNTPRERYLDEIARNRSGVTRRCPGGYVIGVKLPRRSSRHEVRPPHPYHDHLK